MKVNKQVWFLLTKMGRKYWVSYTQTKTIAKQEYQMRKVFVTVSFIKEIAVNFIKPIILDSLVSKLGS